jgi:branched-subunit amino acid transport protein AzlD
VAVEIVGSALPTSLLSLLVVSCYISTTFPDIHCSHHQFTPRSIYTQWNLDNGKAIWMA